MSSEIAKAIAAVEDRMHANVRVAEWGMSVRLRSWTGGDRAEFDAETELLKTHLDQAESEKLMIPRAVAWSIVDEAGNLAFELPTRTKLRELAKEDRIREGLKVYLDLMAKSSKALLRLYRIVSDISALDEEVEIEIEKN